MEDCKTPPDTCGVGLRSLGGGGGGKGFYQFTMDNSFALHLLWRKFWVGLLGVAGGVL